MRVEVIIKKGRRLNRRENGELKTYTEGAKLTVSQHVYESFKDALELVGEAPPEVPTPLSDAPGTDDQPDLVEQVVRALAGVGLKVDPAKAALWTEEEIGRLPKLIERKGKNPPKFVTAALIGATEEPAGENEEAESVNEEAESVNDGGQDEGAAGENASQE